MTPYESVGLVNFIGGDDVISAVYGDLIYYCCCISLFIFQQNAAE